MWSERRGSAGSRWVIGFATFALGASLAGAPGAPRTAEPAPTLAPPQVVGPEYDGRYAFVRVRFGGGGRGFRGGGFYGGGGNWNHDYPAADLNMQAVLAELTMVDPVTDG